MKHHFHILMLSLVLCLTACHSNNTASSGGSANRSPQIPLIPSTIPEIPLSPAKPAITSLIMLGGEQSIAPNTTSQLYAAIQFNNDHIKNVTDKVTWVSSDPSVATISSSGLVKGLKQGKTTIGALYSGLPSNTQDLVISPIQSIQIVNGDHGTPPKEKDFLMLKNSKKQIRIMATLANKATIDISDKVSWYDKDKKIATVDKNGLITAVSAGTTLIIATIKIDSAYYIHTQMQIHIPPSDVDYLTIYGDDGIYKSIKTPTQLVCLLTMNGNQIVDVTKYAYWTSSNTNIASVDKNGLVTGKKAGSTVIWCVFDGISIVHQILFTNPKVVSIKLYDGNQLIKNNPVGPILNNTTQTINLVTSINYPFDINGRGISNNGFYPTAWAVFDDGTKENITKYTSWWSSDQKKVYLNYLKGPYLFGRKLAQNVLITASFAGHSASFNVDVEDAHTEKLASIRIYMADGTEISKGITRDSGTKIRLHAIGYYPNSMQKKITSNILYSTNDPSKAIILNDLNPNVLYFTGVNGSTTMTASWQGVKKTFTVTSK